jgi:hypothetical protein
MGFAQRLLYPALNATWGASLGTCAALLAYQVGSWSGHHPSSGLLLAGSLAIFGAAYVATVIGRGRRPTLRGGAVVAGSAAAVYAGWALAIVAPAWLIVWIAAALAGFVTGLLRPLPR